MGRLTLPLWLRISCHQPRGTGHLRLDLGARAHWFSVPGDVSSQASCCLSSMSPVASRAGTSLFKPFVGTGCVCSPPLRRKAEGRVEVCS